MSNLIRAFVAAMVILSVTGIRGYCGPAEAKGGTLSDQLKEIANQYLTAVNSNDMEACMATVRSRPDNQKIFLEAEKRIAQRDQKFTLQDFRLIDADDSVAVARVRCTMEQQKPPVPSQIIDLLQVFKKESDGWKIWCVFSLSRNDEAQQGGGTLRR